MTLRFKSAAKYKHFLAAKWAITGRTKHKQKVIIGGHVHKVKHAHKKRKVKWRRRR